MFWAFHTRMLTALAALNPAEDRMLKRLCPGRRYCADDVIRASLRLAAPASDRLAGAARPQDVDAVLGYRAAGFSFRSVEGNW